MLAGQEGPECFMVITHVIPRPRSDRYYYPSIAQKEMEPRELRHLPQITQLGRCRTRVPPKQEGPELTACHRLCVPLGRHTHHISGPALSFEAVTWERVFSDQACKEGRALRFTHSHPVQPTSMERPLPA